MPMPEQPASKITNSAAEIFFMSVLLEIFTTEKVDRDFAGQFKMNGATKAVQYRRVALVIRHPAAQQRAI